MRFTGYFCPLMNVIGQLLTNATTTSAKPPQTFCVVPHTSDKFEIVTALDLLIQSLQMTT